MLDNVSGYGLFEKNYLSNVTIEYLTSNTVSDLQPMRAGVIRNLKTLLVNSLFKHQKDRYSNYRRSRTKANSNAIKNIFKPNSHYWRRFWIRFKKTEIKQNSNYIYNRVFTWTITNSVRVRLKFGYCQNSVLVAWVRRLT